VELIEIHIIGVQTPQGCVDRVKKVLARRASIPRGGPHRPSGLGAQKESVALAFQPEAGDLLCSADFRQISRQTSSAELREPHKDPIVSNEPAAAHSHPARSRIDFAARALIVHIGATLTVAV
jgi:hypothetical protein